MNHVQQLEQEKRVLRWGGLFGILSGVCFILPWIWVLALVPEDPPTLAQWVTRFPGIQAIRTVENLICLVAFILAIPLFLSLYRALRESSLAPALFGSVLSIIGMVSMIVGATPHVAHSPLSELYHASGATAGDQAALALMWQATWGIFNALLYVGFFVIPVGIILLGVAMLGTPTLGKRFGVVSIVLGILGLLAAVHQMVNPVSMSGAVSYFAILIFIIVMGVKVYRVSKLT